MQRWAVTCKECHGTAFVVLGALPGLNDVVTASRCEHLDGRPLIASDRFACDSCGQDFTLTGVEPSDQWTLLSDTFTTPHEPNDAPWGSAADAVDIARVRLAIAQATAPPPHRYPTSRMPPRPRRRALRSQELR